ncbi:hypothetical protein [Bacillus suaedaesalsae]|uniref:Aspartate kinase n=1 Tax=Bacillus suaedaesalsae TaxID=2810349 RepID=A0ABS2DCU1_9BACI|nr:hypothetical protein [Bacillus suaedaesalsae]MBM6616263.1 hypothetical protein [Bacillus suaedaesalsae]
MHLPVIYNSLEEAGDNILQLISRMVHVNTFCITSIDETSSYFISVLNQKEILAEAGIKISVYDAY